MQIQQGEILALLGPSGCGKTTILRLIAGFERLDRGEIRLGEQLVASREVWLPPERRKVGMVFQQHALFPHLDVGANVAFGLRSSAAVRRARVAELLELAGLAGMERRMPHQLSGGQQQRVALARALAPNPAVLLLDEPFSNLDADLRVSLRAQVRHILKQLGTTALFVTHDQEEALFMGDRVGVMRAGRLEQLCDPRELFLAPATRFVAEFIGVTNFLPATVHPAYLETELGRLEQTLALGPGSTIELVVRPDDLELVASPQGNARIAERIFRGGEYLYEVELASRQRLRCISNHIHDYAPETRVQVRLAPGHALAWFPLHKS
ncbi:ABC transporter ATP-binding protein [Candidatus Viridilinea mediisalina]|nr:ABC transporter ATP-binding protein [Candidatus Viridilinea mediisalina]